MTFSRPYAGTFSFKGLLPSSFCNSVNDDIVDALDKTGETAALGGGVSGEIEFLSGSSLVFDAGSTVSFSGGGLFASNIEWVSTLTQPTLLQASPLTDSMPGQLTVQAADAFSGASVFTAGGNLVLTSGNPVGSGTQGTILISMGHDADELPILQTNSVGHTLLYGGLVSPALTLLNQGSNNYAFWNIPEQLYSFSVGNVLITQDTQTSGNGSSMTIAAQPASGAGSVGGSLILSAGAGVSGNGSVSLTASASGPTVVATGWTGSKNTQQATYTLYPSFASTVVSGGSVNLGSAITIPNDTGAAIEVTWVARVVGGGDVYGSKFFTVVSCNGSGVVTGTNNASVGNYMDATAGSTSPHVIESGSEVFYSFGTNSIQFQANNFSPGVNLDWECLVSVLLI